MKKCSMLSFANIRKTKGQTISLLLMFVIATMLLNVGLLVLLNFGTAFDQTVKELNTSDSYYLVPNQFYTEEVDHYIETNENISQSEQEEVVFTNATVAYDNDTRLDAFLFHDLEDERELSKWKFVGEHLPAEEMSIYLPYIYKINGGYQLNDPFVMDFGEKELTFTVKGFVEDIFFGSPETGIVGAYVPHDTYEYLVREIDDPGAAWTLVFADLKKMNNEVASGIGEIIEHSSEPQDQGDLYSLDLSQVKVARTFMASLVSAITIVFAVVIFIVCLIVVRFRIGNSIEDDMAKIGSLKAIGYTSSQVINSVVLQFTSIAFIGSLIGIGLSYVIIPAFSSAFAHQSGLYWEQGFDFGINMTTLVVVNLFVVLISYLASRRINQLNPIVAMRGGLVTHSFTKNYLPLETTIGKLSIIFGLKSMLHNLKQTLMIGIITVAVTFSGVFAVVMFYNTAIDTSTFAKTPGLELFNASALVKPEVDSEAALASVQEMPEVRKAQYLDMETVEIDGDNVELSIMDDYSQRETRMIYQGRYPEHSNEIALSGSLAGSMGKAVGDNVLVTVGENEEQFLITGLTQGAHNFGKNGDVTTAGIKRLVPDFKQDELKMYLKEGSNTATFVKELEASQSELVHSVQNADRTIEEGMGLYTGILSRVGIVILTVTILVIVLVLYFVISSAIVRKKRELGIQKALGFTTFQLMNQLSIHFMTPVILGTIVGVLLGATGTNTLMSFVQRGMGVMKAEYIIKPSWMLAFALLFILTSYVSALLIAYRIRKISAYALVSE